jgi:hypothetical protein
MTDAMLPTVRVKPDAAVCTVGPAPAVAGARVTVMPLAKMVEVGNPLPVSRTGCTFGSTTAGRAEAGRMTPEEAIFGDPAPCVCSAASEADGLTFTPQPARPRHPARPTKVRVIVLLHLRTTRLRERLTKEFDMLGLRLSSFHPSVAAGFRRVERKTKSQCARNGSCDRCNGYKNCSSLIPRDRERARAATDSGGEIPCRELSSLLASCCRLPDFGCDCRVLNLRQSIQMDFLRLLLRGC